MGMDEKVNLKQMVNMAESIAKRGTNLGNRFVNIYKDVSKMQQYWQGESYVRFASTVNKIHSTLEKMEEYFARTLPEEIIKKRNNYAKADQKAIVPMISTITKIPGKIQIKDQGDELIFNEAGMLTMRDSLDQRFENILFKNLENIKDDFNKITWKGSTGDKVKSEFKNKMEETITSVKKIRTAFRKCLEEQAKAMNKSNETNKMAAQMTSTEAMKKAATVAETVAANLSGIHIDPMIGK